MDETKWTVDNQKQLMESDLQKKYRFQYAPAFRVLINEQDAVKKGMEINNITVNSTEKQVAHFRFQVTNSFDLAAQEFKWLDNTLSLGDKVTIFLGYSNQLEPLIYGEITAIRVDFSPSRIPVLDITGMDISYAMTMGRKAGSWDQMTDSDVVQKIADQYKIPDTSIDPTGITYERISKNQGESDFLFINRLAQKNSYESFIFGSTLYFRKKERSNPSVVSLEWGKNLISFSSDINIAGQISRVENRGWDVKNNQQILSAATRVKPRGSGEKTAPDLIRQIYGNDIVKYLPNRVNSENESMQAAQKVLDEMADQLVTASGESIGIPDILVGRYLKIEGLGSKFSKEYYIYSTTHVLNESGYHTNFELRSNVI